MSISYIYLYKYFYIFIYIFIYLFKNISLNYVEKITKHVNKLNSNCENFLVDFLKSTLSCHLTNACELREFLTSHFNVFG